MSDDNPKPSSSGDEHKTKMPDPPSSGFSLTALISLLAGGVLIISFFLPVVLLKADRLQRFDDTSAQFRAGLDDIQHHLEEGEQVTSDHAFTAGDHGHTELDERHALILQRILNTKEGEPITSEDLEGAREYITTVRTLVRVPSFWHLFGVADLLNRNPERTLALGERVGINENMLDVVKTFRGMLLGLPVLGLLAVAFTLLNRFRKLNAIFLIILFLTGVFLFAGSGLLVGWTLASENPQAFAEVPAIQHLLEKSEMPFTLGPGAWAIFGASCGLLVAGLFGVSRGNWWICYIFYLLLAGAVATGFAWWMGERQGKADADPAPDPSTAPAENEPSGLLPGSPIHLVIDYQRI